MRIALQNIHRIPGITAFKFHNYAVELIKSGLVDLLFFDDPLVPFNQEFSKMRRSYSWTELGLNKVRVSSRIEDLNTCDILLNFNSDPDQFTDAVKQFSGLKVFHVMDYFWYEPFSEKVKRLHDYDIDFVMAYGSPDLYDSYFAALAPEYVGKCIPVPFGYSERFKDFTSFSARINKCMAIGSVIPMKVEDVDPKNWKERSEFYKDQKWFHPFRHILVEQKNNLSPLMDSYMPEFPRYVDYRYDMVKRFNEYRMFVCDESTLNFPSGKSYEGPASGCVMVCSDHPCFTRYGFEDGKNCIKHKVGDVVDFERVVAGKIKDPELLEKIARQGKKFVEETYSHRAIAQKLRLILERLSQQKNSPVPIHSWAYEYWCGPYTPTHLSRKTQWDNFLWYVVFGGAAAAYRVSMNAIHRIATKSASKIAWRS